MLNSEYVAMVNKLNEDRLRIRESKSKDYSGEDVLSNFKRISTAARHLNISVYSPEGYAMFMILMKLDRINNLRGRKAENESIEDSVIDLHNYADLMYACLKERENIPEAITPDMVERYKLSVDRGNV